MEAFKTTSLVLALLTGLLLAGMAIVRPRVLCKPSYWIAAFFSLRVQWSAVFEAEYIYGLLPKPYEFLILAHCFPLCVALLSWITFARSSKVIWHHIQATRQSYYDYRKEIIVTCGVVLCILIWYLVLVPLSSTGFMSLLTSGSQQATTLAREESLKLQPFYVRYPYGFLAYFLSRFAATVIALQLLRAWSRKEAAVLLVLPVVLAFVVASAGMSGARSFPTLVVLAAVLGVLFKVGLRKSMLWTSLGLAAVLIVPTTIHVLRTAQAVSVRTLVEASSVTTERILEVPSATAVAWVHHAQTRGFWGAAGIRVFAVLMGEPAIPVTNLMALEAFQGTKFTAALMNTSYVFSFYSCLGLGVFPFLVLMASMLDGFLLIIKRLRTPLLIPAIITTNLAVISLAGADYTRIFITGGILPGVLYLFLLHWGFRRSSGGSSPMPRRLGKIAPAV
jgi:hypothetical protein